MPDRRSTFRSRPLARARYLVAAVLATSLCATLGCGRYMVGNETLYAPEIRTVYVPVFDSASFRRNLGEQLTEAVIKEIQLKTPYVVVDGAQADSVLTGEIVQDTKRILVESKTDEGRQVEMNFVVRVSWVDRRGELIRQGSPIPLPTSFTTISANGDLAPEVGQSILTAQQDSLQELAVQIVSLMEAPW